MRARGFTYLTQPYEVLEHDVEAVYTVRDRATVAAEGYGLAHEHVDAPPPQESSHRNETYTKALIGKNGCDTWARRFEQRVNRVADSYGTALLAIWTRYEEHPQIIASETEWRSCMREKGHAFEASSDAEDRMAREFALVPDGTAAVAQFREREVSVALADFDCAELNRPVRERILNILWTLFEARYREDIIADLKALR